jgi:general secretion pathway protein G
MWSAGCLVRSGDARLQAKELLHPRCLVLVRPNSHGFTLLELLVVMVIIGLLVGYVGPRYFAQIGKSEIKAARAQIDAFEKSVELFRFDTGHFPTTEQGLAALYVKPANEPKWHGPYLKKEPPLDPWGNPYVYRAPGQRGDFDVLSLGKDGQPGGEGEAADISN